MTNRTGQDRTGQDSNQDKPYTCFNFERTCLYFLLAIF